MEKVLVHKCKKPFEELYSGLKELRANGKYCDITLKVGDKEILAHKIILASSIPFFQAMFRFDLVTAENNVIDLEIVEAKAVEQLIDYVYSGEIHITPEDVESLMIGASYLQISSVFSSCGEFIVTLLTPENVLSKRKFADYVCSSVLIEATEQFIQDHFIALSNQMDFLKLEKDELVSIIQLDDLTIDSEEDVYKACMKWIQFKEKERVKYFDELFELIRWQFVPIADIEKLITENHLINTSSKCLHLIDEVKCLKENSDFSGRSLNSLLNTLPRAIRIYAVGHTEENHIWIPTLEVFNPVEQCWQRNNEQLTLRRRKFAVAALQNRIYVIAGETPNQYINDVEIYDLKSKTWSLGERLIDNRSSFGAVVLNNLIYVCGGYDQNRKLESVECFCPKRNTWISREPMKYGRGANAAVVFNNEIYVIGGWSFNDPLRVVECYNPESNSWSNKCSLLDKRAYHSAVVLNNKIYVIGGYNGDMNLSTVEVYDFETNQWSYTKPMRNKRAQAAACVYKGKLWVIGGCNSAGTLRSVEIFDPEKNKWHYGPSTVADRYVYGAVIL